MSTAELTAHRIFDSYRFQGLPDDVKRHLAILCISTALSETDSVAEEPLLLTRSEKETRDQRDRSLIHLPLIKYSNG